MAKTEKTTSKNADCKFNGFRWAVVGIEKKNFDKKFLKTHPIDFYENEEDIGEEYDFILHDYHNGHCPYIEYRGSNGNGFECPLTFWGLQPNFAGPNDCRLKHLRMILGIEDFSEVPVDFADIKKILGNKDLTVDGFSFPADVSVETFIRQIRKIGKNRSIENKNVFMVFEGGTLDQIDTFSSELEEWFGVIVDGISAYENNADQNTLNISLWWYDATSEISYLRQRWDRYYDWKEYYLTGEKEIDIDDYCRLVEKTWWYIIHVNWKIDEYLGDKAAYSNVDRASILCFHEYIRLIQRLTYYSSRPEKDLSKDYIYTVTAMLADELARLATGKQSGTPTYNFYGDYIGFGGTDMDVTLAASHPSSTKRVYYSISDKNYQDLFDAAKRLNEEEK